MAIQTEPTRIQIPFADSGTKNVIPDTNSTPSASQAASWTDGFPAQCSLPLSAGGIPPARADFNGILNAMTQSERYTQEGGVWAWDATVDYGTNRVVLGSDGLLYWSVAQSGPNVGGAQDPTTDNGTYWVSPEVPTMPVSDNSYSIANTSWVDSKINDWYMQNSYHSDYYISTSGNDSNDGLTASTPKKTWAGLMTVFSSLLFISKPPVIHIAAGSYNEPLSAPFNGFLATLAGPSSGYATFTIVALTSSNCSVDMYGRFQFTGNSVACIAVSKGSTLGISGATIDISGAANQMQCVLVQSNGVISNGTNTTTTITYSGTNSFTRANFYLENGARCAMLTTPTISVSSGGSVSGTRYSILRGSGISGFYSTTLIPGTTNGSNDSTSYYA